MCYRILRLGQNICMALCNQYAHVESAQEWWLMLLLTIDNTVLPATTSLSTNGMSHPAFDP